MSDVKPGAMVTITAGRGRIVLESRSAAVRAKQKYFGALVPESEIWSDELIADRRRKARSIPMSLSGSDKLRSFTSVFVKTDR